MIKDPHDPVQWQIKQVLQNVVHFGSFVHQIMEIDTNILVINVFTISVSSMSQQDLAVQLLENNFVTICNITRKKQSKKLEGP